MYESIELFIETGSLFRATEIIAASAVLACIVDMTLVILVTFYLQEYLYGPDKKD